MNNNAYYKQKVYIIDNSVKSNGFVRLDSTFYLYT